MALIIRHVSSVRLAEKLDRDFCDPGVFAERLGVARIERGDAAQLGKRPAEDLLFVSHATV
jgi:hypothetical protein